MVNSICDCGKRVEYLQLESLENPIDTQKDSELEIDIDMEDSFTQVNKLYEEAKVKQIKNEVLGDLASN